MKIPDRKIANVMVQEQRRKQIEEGINLAKKIDALRNDLLSLQKQRLEFLESSKIELENSLLPLYEKKDSLNNEIGTLTEIREKLKKELNKIIKS